MIETHRGLVKWYDRGLQNLWREFDSLIPCSVMYIRILGSFDFRGFSSIFIFSDFAVWKNLIKNLIIHIKPWKSDFLCTSGSALHNNSNPS